jgi:DnaA family protein
MRPGALMRQLALQFAVSPPPTLENFVPGRNAELLSTLASIANGTAGERFVYLWGPEASGKSHLLAAVCRALDKAGAAAILVTQETRLLNIAEGNSPEVLCVEDVHLLAPDGQRALFNLYNAVRDSAGVLIASGNAPPAALSLRQDLLTRLGWGLVYQVHPLTDEEKAAALAEHARSRGLRLPAEVTAYLFSRHRRDLRYLVALLEALDRYSLETRRAITVPLVRELLSESVDSS